MASLRDSVVSLLLPEQIYGKAYSFVDVQDRLRKTSLRSALEVMALLNAVSVAIMELRGAKADNRFLHYANLYGFLFAKTRLRRVDEYTNKLIGGKMGEFRPLDPWACSAMTDVCLRLCDPASGAVVFPPSREDYFGRVVLSFQSQLAPDRHLPNGLDIENPSDEQFVIRIPSMM